MIYQEQNDRKSKLPRFNMPLELGVFLGASELGDKKQKKKRCLILDKKKYRYQKFISDLAGHDIESHENKVTATHFMEHECSLLTY
jgi:hypothetical protein